jgi:hypothetical protein
MGGGGDRQQGKERNVIFLHPVARSTTQSLSSVFVRRLVVYLTLKHLKFTTCFGL